MHESILRAVGACPEQVTHAIVQRQRGDDWDSLVWDLGDGLGVTDAPADELSRDEIETRFGVGTYRFQWVRLDAEGRRSMAGRSRAFRIRDVVTTDPEPEGSGGRVTPPAGCPDPSRPVSQLGDLTSFVAAIVQFQDFMRNLNRDETARLLQQEEERRSAQRREDEERRERERRWWEEWRERDKSQAEMEKSRERAFQERLFQLQAESAQTSIEALRAERDQLRQALASQGEGGEEGWKRAAELGVDALETVLSKGPDFSAAIVTAAKQIKALSKGAP